ncbi:hypothetical protein HSISB1_751 [Streptococcus sp. HSISB1]|nr:hypothetical protein HSISB1_751 [Streptococcus sp. HSISB1]
MEELKKVLLAGIGLTSMTLEKADAFVKELVEKGRLTVDEGKELQSELKRRSEDEAKEFLTDLDRKQSQFNTLPRKMFLVLKTRLMHC